MPVIAVHEESRKRYVGFEKDTTLLECSVCAQNASYRVFFTADERRNLEEHLLMARRAIEAEHPRHSFEIFVR